MRRALAHRPFDVVLAVNGSDALAKAAAHQPELILLDIVMPRMDGVDLVTRLRETHPDLPILTISGGSRVVNARFGLDSALLLGANDSLTKPFNAKQLLEKVGRLLAVE